MSALRFLFLTLLLAVDSVLSAEGQRINKTAEPGQDVTLPCAHGKEKIHIIVLEWTKHGLEKKERIDVFIFRDGHFASEGQHKSFKNRVHLQDGEMKDGNASLILKNVKINDTGTYECGVQTESNSPPELISTINLEVSPPPGTQEGGGKEGGGKEARVVDEEGGGKEGGAKEGGNKEGGDKEGGGSLGLTVGLPVSLLCVLVGVAAWIYYKKPACLQRNSQHHPVDQTEPDQL